MIGVTYNMSIESLSVCPRANGIYKIKNIKTGRFYIGKSAGINGFYKRWYCHRLELRNNTHCCSYLQRSYNKYGESCFTFEILEIKDYGVPLADLESEYIINLEAMYFQKGYNLVNEKVESPSFDRENHPLAKEFELLDPEGNLIKVKNLTKFCEDMGLHSRSMWDLVRGGRNSYRGFRSTNTEFHLVPKEYRLISPEGELIIFDNMAEFARIRGLSKTPVYNVLMGLASNTKGYHLENPSPEHQKYLDRISNKKFLVNKSLGTIVRFVSMKAFSRKYKVSKRAILDFYAGGGRLLTEKYNWITPTEEDMELYPIIEETF
jgi:group I intron endonuclease